MEKVLVKHKGDSKAKKASEIEIEEGYTVQDLINEVDRITEENKVLHSRVNDYLSAYGKLEDLLKDHVVLKRGETYLFEEEDEKVLRLQIRGVFVDNNEVLIGYKVENGKLVKDMKKQLALWD